METSKSDKIKWKNNIFSTISTASNNYFVIYVYHEIIFAFSLFIILSIKLLRPRIIVAITMSNLAKIIIKFYNFISSSILIYHFHPIYTAVCWCVYRFIFTCNELDLSTRKKSFDFTMLFEEMMTMMKTIKMFSKYGKR